LSEPEGRAGLTDKLDADVRAALSRIARVPQLLVACDYDGTLAPLVDDPTRAEPLPEAVAAIRALATLPQTTVAVVSGRALRDLATLGSHGSEFDLGFIQRLAPEMIELHRQLFADLVTISNDHPGVRLEVKPASVAVHTRGASGPSRNASWRPFAAGRPPGPTST